MQQKHRGHPVGHPEDQGAAYLSHLAASAPLTSLDLSGHTQVAVQGMFAGGKGAWGMHSLLGFFFLPKRKYLCPWT